MTIGPNLIQLHTDAKAADDAYQAALEEAYGADAGDMRYAAVLPTRIALLRCDKIAADDAYFEALHGYRPNGVAR